MLVEPLYELAGTEAKQRMEKMAYVRGLIDVARRLGGNVSEYRLLEHVSNPLNPSGVIVIEKEFDDAQRAAQQWACPVTHTPLVEDRDLYYSAESGLAYPIVRGIPMLLAKHAVLATRLGVLSRA